MGRTVMVNKVDKIAMAVAIYLYNLCLITMGLMSISDLHIKEAGLV
jgi:hypothetical protein